MPPESMKFIYLNGKCGNFNMKCVFDQKLSTSVGILGFLGLIAAIKFRRHLLYHHPVESDSPRAVFVPGLRNHGNNCFLNVVLQALASCSIYRKYLREMMKEFAEEELNEDMPLVSCLSSLVEELCTVHHERTVASPRELMVAMNLYVPSFNLARQQDAEEAISHLLSLVREEIARNFAPNIKWLADLPRLNSGRFVLPKNIEEESDWQRWRRCFLKPFDGILSSILICQSCSLQVSQDFELFSSLHLSPLLESDGEIKTGCHLKECLEQFFVPDRIANYHCIQCWHNAAASYLSKFSEDKMDVEKVQHCNKNDACDCRTLSSLEEFPWSNRFCQVFKKLSIAQGPEVLCLHLQRGSYSMFGGPVKLEGHISFPFILDFSSFVGYGNKWHDPKMLNGEPSYIEGTSSETGMAEEEKQNGIPVENVLGHVFTKRDSVMKVSASSHLAAAKRQFYRLVSVVEHFGSGKSGHYMVYRRLMTAGNPASPLESGADIWFCISDSDVASVLEEHVRKANASMLFYEKIDSF